MISNISNSWDSRLIRAVTFLLLTLPSCVDQPVNPPLTPSGEATAPREPPQLAPSAPVLPPRPDDLNFISDNMVAFGSYQGFGDDLRDILQRALSRGSYIDLNRYVEEIADSLRAKGLSSDDIYSTIDAHLAGGIGTFSKESEARTHLDKLFPGRLPVAARPASAMLPKCGVFIEPKFGS